MANYNVQYTLPFTDLLLDNWRIDFCLKDGTVVDSPPVLNGGDTPLIYDRANNDETKFEGIIKTTCTIVYQITGIIAGEPLPDVFIDNVVNDTWLINVYKNGEIDWKGFLVPDSNSYPWVPPPFNFTIKATDFTFMESTKVDMNDVSNILLYGYITLGDFINRSIFNSISYDNPQVRVIYSKKPAIIGSDNIIEGIYVHSGAFYDFEVGAEFVNVSLEKMMRSLGARLFQAKGIYYIQFIEDIIEDSLTVITITPDDLNGAVSTETNDIFFMGNGAGDSVIYRNATQEIMLNKALKQQAFDYNLNPINQLLNFDWRTNDHNPFPNWEDNGTPDFQRVGSGSVSDPYRLTILPDTPGPDSDILSDPIKVKSGQLIELTVKTQAFATLTGGALPEDYKVSTLIGVILIDIDTHAQYHSLTAGGSWELAPFGGTPFPFDARPADDPGRITITSEPIPKIDITNLGLQVEIVFSTINPEPPVGSTFYSELFPIFVGVFTNRYISVQGLIVNAGRFTQVADNQDMYFLDIQDAAYTNTLFYKSGSDYIPLPNNNWTNGKTINEIAIRQYIDQQARTTYSVMGDFTSNDINFYNCIALRDRGNMRTMVIRDKYEVKGAKHSMMVSEVLQENAAIAEYTVTPKTKTN